MVGPGVEELRSWTARRCRLGRGQRTEAELVAGMLRSHGVGAAVSADDAAGRYPQMQLEGFGCWLPLG
jgi:hypothetical protein